MNRNSLNKIKKTLVMIIGIALFQSTIPVSDGMSVWHWQDKMIPLLWAQSRSIPATQNNKKPPLSRPYACKIPANPIDRNFRIAVIYFKLADDQFELGPITRVGWPHDQEEPIWKGQFLTSAPLDSMHDKNILAEKSESLTAFFYQMSGGKLWLYGDEITYQGPGLNRTVPDSGKSPYEHWTEINTRIIQWLADNYDLTGLDNDRDGYVDAILLICRARSKFGFQGIARLPINKIYTRTEQPKIDAASGIYQTDCYTLTGTRHIVAHEIGHCLGFFAHINGLHRWGLMSGKGSNEPQTSGVTMSAFEKNKLGWLRYETINETTRNIRLGNLTTSNRAIQILIDDLKDYIVIENRQYSEPFEPAPQDSTVILTTLPGTGLLIYRVYHDQPHIIPADGAVSQVMIIKGTQQQHYMNGDNSDLFGNNGKTEITSFHSSASHRAVRSGIPVSIKNIRYRDKDIIFDIIFN